MTADPRPLIVTAEFDADVQGWLEGLRRVHYPAARNRVPAHMTLFQGLPGRALAEVRQRLAVAAAETPPLPAELLRLEMMEGAGVLVRVACPPLDALRAALAEPLWLLLGAQDRAGVQLHVTVQNKVSAADARATLALLAATFRPRACAVVALRLWRYLDGPWEALARLPLRGRGR